MTAINNRDAIALANGLRATDQVAEYAELFDMHQRSYLILHKKIIRPLNLDELATIAIERIAELESALAADSAIEAAKEYNDQLRQQLAASEKAKEEAELRRVK